jgi:hypothetical protein
VAIRSSEPARSEVAASSTKIAVKDTWTMNPASAGPMLIPRFTPSRLSAKATRRFSAGTRSLIHARLAGRSASLAIDQASVIQRIVPNERSSG